MEEHDGSDVNQNYRGYRPARSGTPGMSAIPTTVHHAEVEWTGTEADPRAHQIGLADQRLSASAAPEFGGDGSKADPEELLVAALSSCHMLWFVHLARERGFRVAGYRDRAEGTMDGRSFTRVVLRPKVGWEGEGPSSQALAELHHESHAACFIANSVTFPVELEP